MRVHSHLGIEVQSLARAAVIRLMRWRSEGYAVSVSDQVLLACVLDSERGNSAQQTQDIFQ
jgi:hypothetical protein